MIIEQCPDTRDMTVSEIPAVKGSVSDIILVHHNRGGLHGALKLLDNRPDLQPVDFQEIEILYEKIDFHHLIDKLPTDMIHLIPTDDETILDDDQIRSALMDEGHILNLDLVLHSEVTQETAFFVFRKKKI